MDTAQLPLLDTSPKIKCTNCKCNREAIHFIGANGDTVKRCKRCRDKDSRQKKKPDVREKKNELLREKQYYKAHREKKREEDEEEYLKHNAEVHKAWRDSNKEHLSRWRTNNVNTRLNALKQGARYRNVDWCETMTYEVCATMMTSPCFYCGFLSTETVNGIDRMDNQSHYTLSNCVSCCKKCNFMKTALDANTFVKRCIHISYCHGGPGELQPRTLWRNSKCSPFSTYRTRATKKELAFELTKEDFNNITEKPCVYCQKENSDVHNNGIDRADDSLGYTIENAVTCCGECNYMKRELHKDEFIKQCIQIASIPHTIPDMPQCTSSLGSPTPKESQAL
jgi:hypothetical protein